MKLFKRPLNQLHFLLPLSLHLHNKSLKNTNEHLFRSIRREDTLDLSSYTFFFWKSFLSVVKLNFVFLSFPVRAPAVSFHTDYFSCSHLIGQYYSDNKQKPFTLKFRPQSLMLAV